MPNATAKDLPMNKTEKVHVKAFAQDNVNTPSQIVDTTSTLVVTNNNPTVVTAALDPSDPRAIILTPVSIGPGIVFVDQSPPCPSGLRLQLTVTVVSDTLPDDRRVDFLSADDPA